MNKDLPVYKAVINEDETLGVDAVALVDFPAIEKDFQTFSKQVPLFKFSSEGDKRIASGPLMVADLPIYRRSKEKGEYYIVFDAQTIEAIVHRFFKNGYIFNVNVQHDNDQRVKDAYLFESYIINRERGVNPPKGYEDLADGSWFGSYKIDDEELWNEFIKSGELRGFSVEGYFGEEKVEMEEEIDVNTLLQKVNELIAML